MSPERKWPLATRTRNQPPAEPVEKEEKATPVVSFSARSSGGSLEVSVWENWIEVDGREVKTFAVSFQRSYKTEKDGWQKTRTLRTGDLLPASNLLTKAYDWINEQPREE